MRSGYEIDAFVKQGKVEQFADGGWDLAKCPYMFEFGPIFWSDLKVKLREAFKCSALFGR